MLLWLLGASTCAATAVCGAGTTRVKNRCVPDRLRLCGEGTTWASTECVPTAETTAILRTSFPKDSAWFDVPSVFIERRRFRRVEDDSIVRTLMSSVESDFRVDDAQGCGWDLRQRTAVDPPCDGAPLVADCWRWTVVMTTNARFAESSTCKADGVGTELWDVNEGLPTGVHLDVQEAVKVETAGI